MNRRVFLLYFAALFLAGLGSLALLPPLEGFDESAHLSSLREIAAGEIPVYGESRIDRLVEGYKGPAPYGSLTPPFDAGLTYKKFFADPVQVETYLSLYRTPRNAAPYAPGEGMNWEAQHPPLYYALMAPLERATEALPFVTQIFILRLFSFLLALAGIAFGMLALCRPHAPVQDSAALRGFLFYPLLLPMLFPEFTRISNDSLCLFLAGSLALLLSRWAHDEKNTRLSLAIGLTLGLGLLTKAFFIPIALATALFMALRLRESFDAAALPQRLKILARALIPALIIGGGWYLYKYMATGDIIGGNDAIRLAQEGGLMGGLAKHFSLFAFLRGFAVVIASWVWAGTWSLARPPALMLLPLLAALLWAVGAFIAEVRRRPLSDPAWFPVYLFGFFGLGFFWHILQSVALNGNGNTPGWYLHILMPWAAPALGIGIAKIRQHRARGVFTGLLIYAGLFQLAMIWAQFALFTGCAVKGEDKIYGFTARGFCLPEAPMLMHRLAITGWPSLAALGFIGAILCGAFLLAHLRKQDI